MREVLDLIDESPQPHDDLLLGLEASVYAVLASLGYIKFVAVEKAIGSLLAEGATQAWPRYHLAEAAWSRSEFERVLLYVGQIPTGFFEERDLLWRWVRSRELLAMAYVRLGDWHAAEDVVDSLVDCYNECGDEHDLATLAELAATVLDATPGSVDLVSVLATLDDLELWVGATLAARLCAF